MSLDISKSIWRVISCSGSIPTARIYHAACSSGNYMFIHGGEGIVHGETQHDLPFVDISTQRNNKNSSIDLGASSSFEYEQKLKTAVSTKGVSLGDNIATKISVVLNKVNNCYDLLLCDYLLHLDLAIKIFAVFSHYLLS